MATETEAVDLQCYRIKEVEQMLSISRSTVYALMASGELPYHQVGRCRRVSHSGLMTFLERNKGSGPRKAPSRSSRRGA